MQNVALHYLKWNPMYHTKRSFLKYKDMGNSFPLVDCVTEDSFWTKYITSICVRVRFEN